MEQRKSAPLIYQLLAEVGQSKNTIQEMKKNVVSKIAEQENMQLDYFEIASEDTLQVMDEKEFIEQKSFYCCFYG